MIHPSLVNVRTFSDFAAVNIDFASHNDKARFWNMLCALKLVTTNNLMRRSSLPLEQLNVSSSTYSSSLSKMTRILRFATCRRRARFVWVPSPTNIDAGFSAETDAISELLDTWDLMQMAPFQGRGRVNPLRTARSTRRLRRAFQAAYGVPVQAPVRAPELDLSPVIEPERTIAECGDPNCRQCRQIPYNPPRRIDFSLFLNGFEPFAGLDPNIMPLLMLEAAS